MSNYSVEIIFNGRITGKNFTALTDDEAIVKVKQTIKTREGAIVTLYKIADDNERVKIAVE